MAVVPHLTHATCRVELESIYLAIGPEIAARIRQARPDPDIDVSWITGLLVNSAALNELGIWWQFSQVYPGLPAQHTGDWSNARP